MSLTAKPAWIYWHSMNGRAERLTIYAPSCCVIRSVEPSFVGGPSPVDTLAFRSNLTIESAHFAGEHSHPVASRLLITAGNRIFHHAMSSNA